MLAKLAMSTPLEDLYQAVILDHYRHPRHRGELETRTVRMEIDNPLCGDELRLDIAVEAGKLQAIAFEGRGCSISQASASIMAEIASGQSVEYLYSLAAMIKEAVHGGDFDVQLIGDAEALQLVQNLPARFQCALLAWNGLLRALAQAAGSPEDS